MNREILFKAKRKNWRELPKEKQWVEGYYCKIDETTYCVEEDYKRFPVPTHHYILQETMTDWGLPNRFLQFEIDPDTICQYTGLTDKNDQKIWENDIVVDKDNDYYKVFWNKNLCNYSLECIKTEHLFLRGKRWDLYLFVQNDTLKVIENIFDNSELLEVE